jgi:hypothetical protein
MFQFVNMAELFYQNGWEIRTNNQKIIYPFKINRIYKTKPIALNGKTK